MHLAIINPIGLATSLDLHALAVWRLELRVQDWPGGTGQKGLALGVAYPSNGVGAFTVIAAINCLVTGPEVDPIAKLGFEKADRSENKARLKESLKALFNADLKKELIEEVIGKSGHLVDAYHDIVGAMWANNTPLSGGVGPFCKGAVDGWRWALLRERFSNWIIPGGDGAAAGVTIIPPSPAVSPTAGAAPTLGAGGGVAQELAGARDPLAGTPAGLGPPPGSPKSRSKVKKAEGGAMPPAPSSPPAEPPAGPPASTADE